jgi:hypothetical protein
MARVGGDPSSEGNALSANKRARGRCLPVTASRDTVMLEEVTDALASTPAERIEAMVALLDSAYELLCTVLQELLSWGLPSENQLPGATGHALGSG